MQDIAGAFDSGRPAGVIEQVRFGELEPARDVDMLGKAFLGFFAALKAPDRAANSVACLQEPEDAVGGNKATRSCDCH